MALITNSFKYSSKFQNGRLTVVIDQEYNTSIGLQSLDCVQVEQMTKVKIQSNVISKIKFGLNSAKTGQTLRLRKRNGY